MFFYHFMHSSESILGVRENFQKLDMISEFFFKEKLEVISLQKHVGFSARQLIFLFLSFFFFFLFY